MRRRRETNYMPPSPGDQGYEYDLKDPTAVSEIKRFEVAFSVYEKKYKDQAFNRWCSDRGLYKNCEWVDGKLKNYSIAGRESENGTLVHPAVHQSEQLFDGLRRLRFARSVARSADKESADQLVARDLPF